MYSWQDFQWTAVEAWNRLSWFFQLFLAGYGPMLAATMMMLVLGTWYQSARYSNNSRKARAWSLLVWTVISVTYLIWRAVLAGWIRASSVTDGTRQVTSPGVETDTTIAVVIIVIFAIAFAVMLIPLLYNSWMALTYIVQAGVVVFSFVWDVLAYGWPWIERPWHIVATIALFTVWLTLAAFADVKKLAPGETPKRLFR